jgi:Spy/CpxP family protein refolding chaperone
MRILSIIALAAMTFGFASCAKKAAPAPMHDGKTMHGHGYKK